MSFNRYLKRQSLVDFSKLTAKTTKSANSGDYTRIARMQRFGIIGRQLGFWVRSFEKAYPPSGAYIRARTKKFFKS